MPQRRRRRGCEGQQQEPRVSLLQQTQHDAPVACPPTAEEQPAAQGVRSARRPRRAAAADSAESAQTPRACAHIVSRECHKEKASARVYSTRPCAKQSEWRFCPEHACELPGRALRRWRSLGARTSCRLADRKDRAHARVATLMGGSLGGGGACAHTFSHMLRNR